MPIRERQKWYLREWRKHRGLSQERLAERFGTTKSRISELETGKERYNQDVLEMLADALDCEPGDLLMRNPLEPDPTGGLFDALRRVPEKDMPRVTRAVLDALLPPTPPVDLKGKEKRRKAG
jgi:transcriptional regulator with XRE-family HTH domain